tara:strand:- start:1940 stop:2536 length:597 start_codon:yes stop_codon:yes gene_type:complete
MSNEARVLDSFGPNLVIETNGPVGVGGGFAYQLYAKNKKGATWQQALHESGLATMEASDRLEIQTGKKNKSGNVSFIAMAHHGDVCLNSNSGWVRIKGKNVVIDATNQLLLQGKHILLGNANKETADAQIIARKIEINGSKEVKITGATKITKESGNIFLKASHHKVMNGLAKAAFIPGQYRIPGNPAYRRNLTLGDF